MSPFGMIRTHIVRCLSTQAIVDRWFSAFQSRKHEEQQTKLAQCIEVSFQQDQSSYANLIREIIHRWVIEQPKTEALWTYKNETCALQKLTFEEIYTQSTRLANALTGNQFNLTAGKSVLVVLPCATKERILIQLACLQSDIIFNYHDTKYLIGQDIRQQIRTSAIDCIITDHDHLEFIAKYTHNSFRPLKKGLLTNQARSEPLPVGWHYLMHSIDSAEKSDSIINLPKPSPRTMRHLLSDKPVNHHAQALFSLRQMLIAYWLNMHKTPRLIWLKEANAKISFAPWLLGSTIFFKDDDSIQTMFKTLETNPIDTFFASETDYQLLDKQQQQPSNSTHLEQLLSTEPINDPTIKSQWYSATNLQIRDSFAQLVELNEKSTLACKQWDGFNPQRIQMK